MFADHSYYFLSKNLPTNLLRVFLLGRILWLRWANFLGIEQYYLICELDFFMHRRGRRERRGGEKRECFRSVEPQSTPQLISHSKPPAREQDIAILNHLWISYSRTLLRGGLGWGKKFTTPARIAIYLVSWAESEHYERKLSLGCSNYHFPDITPLSLNSSRLTRAS